MTAAARGHVTPGFETVAEAFVQGMDDDGPGAGLCVYADGRAVVDLTAGMDLASKRAFTPESLVVVQSATKGATAIVANMLIAEGVLDPDAPVAAYWPDFAQCGKAEATVRQVLSHTVGLPDVDPEVGLVGLETLTGERLVRALAESKPWWDPGTAWSYHATTYGTLAGELVLRVTGSTLGQEFRRRISEPLGLDFWIGLPNELHDRIARPTAFPSVAVDDGTGSMDVHPTTARILSALNASIREYLRATDATDTEAWPQYLSAEIPAAGGVTNAPSLARMYAATLGPVDGIRLLEADSVELSTRPHTDEVPNLGPFGDEFRFGLGFQLTSATMPGLSPRSYGHPGSGGHLGFADPTTGIGFGFVTTEATWPGGGSDQRWQRILDALKRRT